ncbi:MAG: biotin/lipoate--protein ligase family protein [Pseudolabrys sp.]
MPLETRTRAGTGSASEVTLPPPFSLVSLREVGDAFAHATGIAAESGAGTLTYVGRFDLAEFAVVLEPDEPLRIARRAFYAGMAALTESIVANGPPEMGLEIVWPDAVNINFGLVGGGRLGWPKGVREDEPPPWLVFGAMIRTVSMSEEPGLHPMTTALEQEGFTDLHSIRLLESFARHLMVVTDAWQEQGFGAVASGYLRRLAAEKGVRRHLDDNGDLLIRHMGKTEVERKPLLDALAKPSWLDARSQGPRI